MALQREAELLEIRLAVDSVEQNSHHKNIEIQGVEGVENEDLLKVVADLTVRRELPPPGKESVEAVQKLRTNQGTKAPIIIRFQDKNIRDLWIEKRGGLRKESIYNNENLRGDPKCILWVTSTSARERGFRFVWVCNGKLFAR